MGHGNQQHFEYFYSKFRPIIILSFWGGLYIPGMEMFIPNVYICSKTTFAITYCVLYNLPYLWILTDWGMLQRILYREGVPFLEHVYLFTIMMLYIWATSMRLYLIWHRKRLANLVRTWENSPNCLWPEDRDKSIEQLRKRSLWKMYGLQMVYVAPYLLHVSESLYTQRLLVHSAFGHGQQRLDADIIPVLLQASTIIAFTYGYVMHQSLFSLLFGLIYAELDYLCKALRNTVQEAEINHYENQDMSLAKLQDGDIITKERLKTCITYHVHIIELMENAQITFGGLLLVEFVTISLNVCILIYCALVGAINAKLAAGSLAGGLTFLSVVLLSCRIGDQIQDKCDEISNVAYGWNWAEQSPDVKKCLIMIMGMAQRPFTLFAGRTLFPMTSTTFRKMFILQYRFFQFVANVNKSQHKQQSL